MKNLYIAIIALISATSFGQIQQNVNKTTGTISNPITEIDSIRFNANQTQMEIILQNGSIQNHSISTINNVTFSGQLIGSINSLDCEGAIVSGSLIDGVPASGVSVDLTYTGGNGGTHNGQTVASTGVQGLVAILGSDNFTNGAGTLTYDITGTPNSYGTASFAIEIGGETCTLEMPVEAGSVVLLDCAGATINGTIVNGVATNGVSSEISYTGGNGGLHNGQIVSSTGVTGLTAELPAGNFSVGSGTLTYEITGIPNADGTASFAIEIGGETCTLEVIVEENPYTPGTVHCVDPTDIVDVTNPVTGKTWMDRNLGASQVATSSTDAAAYGDLYQWGRRSDGHQCRSSATTNILSSIDQPAHGDFIILSVSPNDWRNPQNTNLWQGINGVNNPCPSGYRLPTETELNAERVSWSSSNPAASAFSSPLKLPMAGYRHYIDGSLYRVGERGLYWSSSLSATDSRRLLFSSSHSDMLSFGRAYGFSVRCIKN